MGKYFSECVTEFQGERLPSHTKCLAGYAAIIVAHDLLVPPPLIISTISFKHRRDTRGKWAVFTPRHEPEPSLRGHLVFALKYEGIDLGVLKALFQKAEAVQELVEFLRAEPTGGYSRRLWFLYEWLMEQKLDLPEATSGNFVPVVDLSLQYGGREEFSHRHRVKNNLPGTRNFCPLVRRTALLERFQNALLHEKVSAVIGPFHKDVIARAASFLLLKDSKASFAIEGERPSPIRAHRWGRALAEAGTIHLSKSELLRLQTLIIRDSRFTPLGWRRAGGFIGSHDRETGAPLPEHISARAEDLPTLLDGLLALEGIHEAGGVDPVISASLLAFGFVFIHPFVDGNGRIHRYLFHHILAARGFCPKGLVFPISAVILNRLNEYRKVLESFSRPRLDFVDWSATDDGNVEIRNDTSDLFRYYDATPQAEFLYECVKETIDEVLPHEVAYLVKYDRMKSLLNEHFDMPERLVELIIRFLDQHHGSLSTRVRERELDRLTENEVEFIEEQYGLIFGKQGVGVTKGKITSEYIPTYAI